MIKMGDVSCCACRSRRYGNMVTTAPFFQRRLHIPLLSNAVRSTPLAFGYVSILGLTADEDMCMQSRKQSKIQTKWMPRL